MTKPKLLIIGDYDITGYGRVIKSLFNNLRNDFEIHQLVTFGVDPDWDGQVHIAPKGDVKGLQITKTVIDYIKPDYIFVLQDIWFLGQYDFGNSKATKIAYVPISTDNTRQEYIDSLKKYDICIFYTTYGYNVALAKNFRGKGFVLPHGVDSELFKPKDRAECRKILGLPQDKIIIGNVNVNQLRKRMDLTLIGFKRFLETRHNHEDYLLYLHYPNKSFSMGYDLKQLASFLQITNHVVFTDLEAGIPDDEFLVNIYNSLDAQITTTSMEAWGLTTLEGMACGIPQACPDISGIGDWTSGVVHKFTPTIDFVLPGGSNMVGKVADMDTLIKAFEFITSHLHKHYTKVGLKKAKLLNWEAISKAFMDMVVN